MLNRLRKVDPEIYEAIREEVRRQQVNVELIASENFDRAVADAETARPQAAKAWRQMKGVPYYVPGTPPYYVPGTPWNCPELPRNCPNCPLELPKGVPYYVPGTARGGCCWSRWGKSREGRHEHCEYVSA